MKLILSASFTLLSVYQVLAFRVSNLADINGNELFITEIDLSNKGLRQFPAQILACKNLISLDLSNNGIIELPAGLAELTELKTLNLSQNRGLSASNLDDIFTGAQFSLTSFAANECNLLYLPSALADHADLVSLSVSKNRLTFLPYTYMQLSKLQHADVSSNYIQNLSWIVNYWWSLKTIDFSDNENILASSVLTSLSYFDRLESITFSNLDFFPKDLALLNVKTLTIKNSTIRDLPNTGISPRIDRLYVENCKFEKPEAVVSTLNESIKPKFVHFSNMNAGNLGAFLQLRADSVTLFKLGPLDISAFKNSPDLKWLDVRGNKIAKSSVEDFVKERPDVELLTKELIRADTGVAPPIPAFVSEPTLATIQAGAVQKVEIGKSYFEIPAEGILDADGNVYTGEVNLAYREFTTPAEILLSGITMTSEEEDGEVLMFSSGGMFELTATDPNGAALFVNPENPIQVEMFTGNTDPNMEIFALNENGVWEQTGGDSIVQPFMYDQLEQDSIMTTDFISKVNSQVTFSSHRYVPVVKRNRKMNSFEITFKKYRTWGLGVGRAVKAGSTSIDVFNPDLTADYLTTKRFVFEGEHAEKLFESLDSISKYCQKQYKRLRMKRTSQDLYTQFGPNYISAISLMPDFENDCYNLNFDFKGEKYALPVTLMSGEFESAGMLSENKAFFTKYALEWKKEKKMQNTNMRKLKTIIQKRVNVLKRREYMESEKLQELTYMEQPSRGAQRFGEVALGTVSLMFQIASFGIHNADARVRMTRPDPISKEFVNDAMEKISDDPEDIYVIDHTINGVVQYDENDKVFCDKGRISTVLVFFASGMVGIYHSWKNIRTAQATEIEIIDPVETDRETFMKRICYDY